MDPFEMWPARPPAEYRNRASKRVTGAEGEKVDLAAVLAHLGPGWSVDADLAGIPATLPTPAVAG